LRQIGFYEIFGETLSNPMFCIVKISVTPSIFEFLQLLGYKITKNDPKMLHYCATDNISWIRERFCIAAI